MLVMCIYMYMYMYVHSVHVYMCCVVGDNVHVHVYTCMVKQYRLFGSLSTDKSTYQVWFSLVNPVQL